MRRRSEATRAATRRTSACRLVRIVVAGVLLAALSPAAIAAAGASTDDRPLFLQQVGELRESSGVDVSAQHRLLWTHNDAGSDPVVFGLATTGDALVRATVFDVTGEDWEDISVAAVDDRWWVYLADLGDAFKVRKAADQTFRRRFEVIRFPEPAPSSGQVDRTVRAERFPVEFDGREGVNVESMAVRGSGEIILVEKVAADAERARVWSIRDPRQDRPNVPRQLTTVPVTGASAADIATDDDTLTIRTNDAAHTYSLAGLTTDGAEPLQPPRQLPRQELGEGLAFTADDTGLVLTGEGTSQAVWFVPLRDGAQPAFGPAVAVDPPAPPRGAVTPRTALPAVATQWPTILGASAVGLVVIAALLRRRRRRRTHSRERGAIA